VERFDSKTEKKKIRRLIDSWRYIQRITCRGYSGRAAVNVDEDEAKREEGGQPDVKKTGCILDQPSAEYGSGGVVVHMSRIRLGLS